MTANDASPRAAGWGASVLTRATPARRLRAAVALVAAGAVLSILAVVGGVTPGTALVPLSLSAVAAFLITPFPAADYLLAFGTLLSLPLLPSSSLPNLPVGLAAVGVAFLRLAPSMRRLPRRALLVLGLIWLPLVIGVALMSWPAMSMWLRPVVILGAGAAMTAVGAVAAVDRERLQRWIIGWAAAALLVAVTAAIVFLLQFAAPVTDIADGLAGLLGYLRGEGAAKGFATINNWIIAGPDTLTLRAVSPFMPAPTNVGGYLGITTPLALTLWLAATSRGTRRLGALAVAATTFTLVATFSRSTWVGSGALAVVVAMAVARPSLRRADWWPNRAALARLLVVSIAPAVLAFALIGVVGQPATTVRVERPLDDPSVQQRIEIDRGAVIAIQANPLRGAGLGNWEASLGTTTGVAYVHNVYLEYAVAAGLFGGVWVVALLAGILVPGAWLLLRRGSGQTLHGLALVAIGAFAAAQFLFDDNMLNPQYVWALTFVVGAAVALPLAHVAPALSAVGEQ